jgi:hypothetical protein
MDQLNVQKDLPDPILELAELANNNNNNSEDPRLSRQLSVTGHTFEIKMNLKS